MPKVVYRVPFSRFVKNHLPEDLTMGEYYDLVYENVPRKRFDIFGIKQVAIARIYDKDESRPGKVVIKLSARAAAKWLEEFRQIAEQYEKLLEDKNTEFEIDGEVVIIVHGQKKSE